MPDDALRHLLSEPTLEPDRPFSGRRWVLLGIFTAAVVAGGIWVLRSSGGEPAAGDGSTTTTAPESKTTFPGLVLEDPPVYAPTLGPEPQFDTGPLGPEQRLAALDQFALAERRWFIDLGSRGVDVGLFTGHDFSIEPELNIAVGSARPTAGSILMAHGIASNPTLPGYGGPGVCVRVLSSGGQFLDRCFAAGPSTTTRPLGVGSGLLEFVAWALIPDGVSVAVLNVNGSDLSWQRPRSGIVLFDYSMQENDRIRLRLLDPHGVEVGVADRWPPTAAAETYVDPIGGYGDFSALPHDEVDAYDVSLAIVECLTANGVSAYLQQPDPANVFADDPDDVARILRENSFVVTAATETARSMHARCRAGLSMPEAPAVSWPPPRSEYDRDAAFAKCLIAAGDTEMTLPPPFEVWAAADPDTQWHPFRVRRTAPFVAWEECMEAREP